MRAAMSPQSTRLAAATNIRISTPSTESGTKRNPSSRPQDRKLAIVLFSLFMFYWATLVILGSFFRGEGFNFVYPWKNGLFFEL